MENSSFQGIPLVIDQLKPDYKIIGTFMWIWYYGTLIPYILIRKKEFWSNGCYRLIFHLGIMDMYAVLDWSTSCWLMTFGTNPMESLFGVGWIFSPTIDDVGFLPTNIMTFALAINRLVAISRFTLCLNEKTFANISALLMYGSTLFLISLNLIPVPAFKEPVGSALHGSNISVLNFEHRVGCPNNWGRPVWILGSGIHYLQIGTLLGSIIIYVVCLSIIVSKKTQGGTKIMSANEWRLLLLTLIPCTIKTFSQIIFYYVCASDYVGQFVQLWFLVLEQGYHPFLYMIVNKYPLLKLYCCGKVPQFRLVTVAPTTQANNVTMTVPSNFHQKSLGSRSLASVD